MQEYARKEKEHLENMRRSREKSEQDKREFEEEIRRSQEERLTIEWEAGEGKMSETCRRRKAQQWQENNRRMMEQVANMALLKRSEKQVGRHFRR